MLLITLLLQSGPGSEPLTFLIWSVAVPPPGVLASTRELLIHSLPIEQPEVS